MFCVIFPDFSSLYKILWLFNDWKIPSHFPSFSSLRGNPEYVNKWAFQESQNTIWRIQQLNLSPPPKKTKKNTAIEFIDEKINLEFFFSWVLPSKLLGNENCDWLRLVLTSTSDYSSLPQHCKVVYIFSRENPEIMWHSVLTKGTLIERGHSPKTSSCYFQMTMNIASLYKIHLFQYTVTTRVRPLPENI